MGTFFIISGLLISISIFLYFINFLDSGKRKLQEIKNASIETAAMPANSIAQSEQYPSGVNRTLKRNEAVRNLSNEMKNMLPERKCPLCSTILHRDEPLYATNLQTSSGRKILIHGCPYCYKEESKEKIS